MIAKLCKAELFSRTVPRRTAPTRLIKTVTLLHDNRRVGAVGRTPDRHRSLAVQTPLMLIMIRRLTTIDPTVWATGRPPGPVPSVTLLLVTVPIAAPLDRLACRTSRHKQLVAKDPDNGLGFKRLSSPGLQLPHYNIDLKCSGLRQRNRTGPLLVSPNITIKRLRPCPLALVLRRRKSFDTFKRTRSRCGVNALSLAATPSPGKGDEKPNTKHPVWCLISLKA